MPRKPRKAKQVRSMIKRIEIYFLQYGTVEGGPDGEGMGGEIIFRKADEKRDWLPIWEEIRGKVMADWINEHPASRPWAWWRFDAPRWKDPFEDCYCHGTFAEPRQRLGGTGTPDFEALNYVPSFDKGVPTGFVSQWDEEYYNGRAKDIHGNPIGTKYKEGHFKGKAIDPDDPPRYESEAAYLQRLGLLTPAEEKYLQKHPELLEPETVILEDDKDDDRIPS